MRSLNLLLPVIAACLSGCTDTVESVTREYRNANNEAIDAMMMVTSEARAAEMITRVLSTTGDRYKAIDKRLNTVYMNSATKDEFVKAVFESDGAHMYLTEVEINAQRYSLELLRIRKLAKQYADDGTICPKLDELIKPDGLPLMEIKNQLTRPKLVEMMEGFPSWKMKQPDNYEKYFEIYAKKRKEFGVKDITLVW